MLSFVKFKTCLQFDRVGMSGAIFLNMELLAKDRFLRWISVASNAIETIDNETAYLIIYCSNCIRRDEKFDV